MKYIVLHEFYDLQDGERHYRAGDEYPRPGAKPGKARLNELAGDQNRQGRRLIAGAREATEGVNGDDA